MSLTDLRIFFGGVLSKPCSSANLLIPVASFSVLIFLGVFLCVIPEISSSSEAREAEVIRSILHGGEWLLPQRHGVLPSKPPLMHWAAASLGFALPVPEIVLARLVSLGGFLSICLLMLTVGERRAAILAVCILASSYGALRMAGDARVDMLFAAIVFLAVVPILRRILAADTERGPSHQDFTVFFLAGAASVLAKGPLGLALVGLLFVFLSFVAYGAGRTVRQLLLPRVVWLPALAIATGWYALTVVESGGSLVERQLVFENLKRFTGGSYIADKPAWYYLPAWFRLMAPWSIALFIVLLRDVWLLRKGRLNGGLVGSGYVLLFACLIPTGFFSLASGKRASYLLPLLPVMSLFLAHRLISLWDTLAFRRKRNIVRWSAIATNVLGVLAVCFVIGLLFLSFIPVPSEKSRLFIGAILERQGSFLSLLVCGVLLGLFFSARSSSARLFPVSLSIGMLLALIFGNSLKADLRGFLDMSHCLNSITSSRVAAVRPHREEYYDPVMYYLARPVELLPPGELRSPGTEEVLLAKREVADGLSASDLQLLGAPRYAMRQPGDQVRGKRSRDLLLYSLDTASFTSAASQTLECARVLRKQEL